MPFKSKAQARYLFSQEPGVAKEFASKTPSVKKLPERVGPKDPSKNKPVTSAFKKGKKGPGGTSTGSISQAGENVTKDEVFILVLVRILGPVKGTNAKTVISSLRTMILYLQIENVNMVM